MYATNLNLEKCDEWNSTNKYLLLMRKGDNLNGMKNWSDMDYIPPFSKQSTRHTLLYWTFLSLCFHHMSLDYVLVSISNFARKCHSVLRTSIHFNAWTSTDGIWLYDFWNLSVYYCITIYCRSLNRLRDALGYRGDSGSTSSGMQHRDGPSARRGTCI